MRLRRQTSTTGRPRRWRIPALLAASALTGTAITIGAAAPSAQAGTPFNVSLGGRGVVSSLCQQVSNTVYALPGSTVTFVSDTTGLQLPNQNQVANLLGLTGGLLGGVLTTVQNVLNSLNLNQVVTTVTQNNAPIARTGVNPGPNSSFTFTQQGTYTLAFSTVLPVQNKSFGLIDNTPFTIVVSADANNCGLTVRGNAPVNVPGLPSINVNVPGVGGVQVGGGNGSSSAAPAPSTSAPAATAPAATGSATVNPYSYDPAACGPCSVVPRGSGNGGRVGAASGVTFSDLDDPAAGGSSSAGSAAADGTADGAAFVAGGNDADAQLAVDRAFADGGNGLTDGAGLPTGLTIVAVAALAGASVLWFARRRLARG